MLMLEGVEEEGSGELETDGKTDGVCGELRRDAMEERLRGGAGVVGGVDGARARGGLVLDKVGLSPAPGADLGFLPLPFFFFSPSTSFLTEEG